MIEGEEIVLLMFFYWLQRMKMNWSWNWGCVFVCGLSLMRVCVCVCGLYKYVCLYILVCVFIVTSSCFAALSLPLVSVAGQWWEAVWLTTPGPPYLSCWSWEPFLSLSCEDQAVATCLYYLAHHPTHPHANASLIHSQYWFIHCHIPYLIWVAIFASLTINYTFVNVPTPCVDSLVCHGFEPIVTL